MGGYEGLPLIYLQVRDTAGSCFRGPGPFICRLTTMPEIPREFINDLYRRESPRILATLIRILGDFDLAEEGLHDAFMAAVEQWPRDGIPGNPRAWLVSAGRFKAIDMIRRRARFDASLSTLAENISQTAAPSIEESEKEMGDDQLRLIFTCCHPAIPEEARLALTLREVCGLTTEEIARAFLITNAAAAQRIVRAKSRIRSEQIPFQVPTRDEWDERLETVLRVVYLLFNEGYSPSAGEELTRPDLSGEAIRLGRLVVELVPEPEAAGLLALMLLQESRRPSRLAPTGEIVLLENQDRSLWNREYVREGLDLLVRVVDSGRVGAYTIQAAIAGEHARAMEHACTNWKRIVELYDQLFVVLPSPVVELNRAAAVAAADSPEAGLRLIENVMKRGELADYYPAHSALAELYRRTGDKVKARHSYERALDLARLKPERDFLLRRLAEL